MLPFMEEPRAESHAADAHPQLYQAGSRPRARPPGPQTLHITARIRSAESVSSPDGSSPVATATRGSVVPVRSVSPHMTTSHDGENEFLNVRDLAGRLRDELSSLWVLEHSEANDDEANVSSSSGFLHQRIAAAFDERYRDEDGNVLDAEISKWLDEYDGYKDGRWTGMSAKPEQERDMYKPFATILTDIIEASGNTEELDDTHPEPIKTRKVEVTANNKLAHVAAEPSGPAQENVAPPVKSCPDIIVFGTGPCVGPERQLPSLSYRSALSPFELKPFDVDGPELPQEIKDQLSVYAHQVLVCQPNRNFVRIPLVGPNTLRVAHFDRGGPHVSPAFDYHTKKGAILFFKLVWLLSSIQEDDLGYDTSIFWKDGERHVTVQVDKNTTRTLQIMDSRTRPLFFRRTIVSRGTKCWGVKDVASGAEFYLKDYWMADKRTAETVFLEKLRGVFGVAELHYFQTDIATVYEQRLRTADEDLPRTYSNNGIRQSVNNRSLMRLVLKRYAGALSDAPTALHFLRAIRDIVIGHRLAFVDRDILHRDISFNNILITQECLDGSDDGSRPYAVLIDFDMAFSALIGRDAAEGKTGTRAFQSIKILLDQDGYTLHDIMDDLESIFYVLCYACCCYTADGRRSSSLPKTFAGWFEEKSDESLGQQKQGFMGSNLKAPVLRFSGPARHVINDLLKDLRAFFKLRLETVDKFFSDLAELGLEDSNLRPEDVVWEELTDDEVGKSYDTFLKHLQTAISKLENLPASSADSRLATPSMAPTPSATSSGSPKRPRQEGEGDEPTVVGMSPHATKRVKVMKDTVLPIPGPRLFRDPPAASEHEADAEEEQAPRQPMQKIIWKMRPKTRKPLVLPPRPQAKAFKGPSSSKDPTAPALRWQQGQVCHRQSPNLPPVPPTCPVRTFVDVKELKRQLALELHNSWVIEDVPSPHPPAVPFQTLIEAAFNKKHPALHQKIRSWLDDYPGYNSSQQRWKRIPDDPEQEKDLYEPLAQLIRDIIAELGHAASDGKTREVLVTATTKLGHLGSQSEAVKQSDGLTELKSCPDISLLGTGPCGAAERELPSNCDYRHIYTPWEVKLLSALTQAVKEQLSVYAHEVIVQQPNRNFVRVPLITPKELRIVHFDRGGVHASAPFDYHKIDGAILFVKLVYLCSSLDEAEVGYDTSVSWKDGSRYIEVKAPCEWNATSSEWRAKQRVLKLKIMGDAEKPAFFRRTIRSRGTTCWIVQDEKKQQYYYLKDYWMSRSRTEEWTFLKTLRGVSHLGIAEMVAWQDDIATVYRQRDRLDTDALWGTYSDLPEPILVDNRVLIRLVLKLYVGVLSNAPTAYQLLRAVRDIVRGHQAAFEMGILHRDISYNNILITLECLNIADDSRPYAALIDFDMAQTVPSTGNVEGKTGTRAFQSVKVLLSEDGNYGAHDVMDDLESVLYVLSYTCFAHGTNGKLLSSMPTDIAQWFEEPSAATLATLKESFVRNPLGTPSGISRFADKHERRVVFELLGNLQGFFQTRTARALRISKLAASLKTAEERPLETRDDEEITDLRSQIAAEAAKFAHKPEDCYADVLALFDQAITALPLPSANSSPATPATPTTPPKRGRSDDTSDDPSLDNSPNTKKLKGKGAMVPPEPPRLDIKLPKPKLVAQMRGKSSR
uniref:Protein kinase domain-containing protein n=1 Tax=Mycena chlorophos TaxID=658473 RepID=A0ABQ0LDE1_MYCCL|nr:predicted protein [Mycena chlorophos]